LIHRAFPYKCLAQKSLQFAEVRLRVFQTGPSATHDFSNLLDRRIALNTSGERQHGKSIATMMIADTREILRARGMAASPCNGTRLFEGNWAGTRWRQKSDMRGRADSIRINLELATSPRVDTNCGPEQIQAYCRRFDANATT
jgi:hypothetical protein